MGMIRTLPAVLATSAGPTPVYTGTPIASVSAVIANGVATVVVAGDLPDNGFNGPKSPGLCNAQQVTLWSFGTTFAFFNGKTVTVKCKNSARSFSFAYDHADVGLASDTAGFAAACPFQHYQIGRAH